MIPFSDVREAFAPPPAEAARRLIRRLCTSNPFYVLSAGLFLLGLWMSFGADNGDVQTWPLMSGLAGYTLLLAVTACLLVRFGNVWDDVRTVLLLVVLMFLATSVTFDGVLIANPGQGVVCSLGGLVFAVAISEALLRGTRLALPALFRLPYYLILALFFLYPLALSRLAAGPRSEALMWGLFGFCPMAGLVFLTLLPAIRRGPAYVRGNGSPWRWPLYPWVLFGVLGGAVPARSILLCISMDQLVGADLHRLIFGPYFLVPFGLALAVLLLEIGLVAGRRHGVLGVALAVPAGLVALAVIGHQPDPIYQGFLEAFTARLGGDPLVLTLLASTGFYAYAALRGVSAAAEALSAVLAALAVVGPHTLTTGELGPARPLPVVAAAVLQLGLGLWRRSSWRCLLGSGGLATAAALALPEMTVSLRGLIVWHLALIAVLTVGAGFSDTLGRALRGAGAVLVLLACLAAMFGAFAPPPSVPPWAVGVYPLVAAALLAVYGLLLDHRPSLVAAVLVLTGWLGTAGWQGYRGLREVVTGLDHIALSLALFAVAILVSLAKAGVLSRWIAARGWKVALPADSRTKDMPGLSP